MDISLNYGKTSLGISLDKDWEATIIEKQDMPVIDDPLSAISKAFSKADESGSLEEVAKGKSSVCILICDVTRPVPNGLILPQLIERLIKAGIKKDCINVLVATGLHRPNIGDELLEIVGSKKVLETVRVENHYARKDEDHVVLCTSKSGLAIKIDRRFAMADLKIVVGLVEPHFMAGYSGGRKLVIPGVAHHKTITGFHTAKFLEHPCSRTCNLKGNPFHEFQLEGIRTLSNLFAVNVVIDEKRNLSFVNFGDIEKSHARAIQYLKQYAEIKISEKFSTILTSAGGYPLDKTYYQTVKAMVTALDILEPGGDIIVVSECSEGMGSDEYLTAQKLLFKLGKQAFLEKLNSREYAEIDEWQTEMQLKPMRIGNIHLFAPKLSEKHRKYTYVNNIFDLNKMLCESIKRSGNRKIAVIPEGPYVIPFYEKKKEK
ncbi:MAG: nickel-dependent lactate racemase [Deltaproteobacteria bacterium]|uniref:nickel-dependent lactate racemase n=1 Tax=Desulfobacula sp. TaxID=2593537 RepID=UPI0019879B1E|nr:nickel-dependent lactate racemase [Candidatus Desulfobacula maris]MBL6992485.1 nickel-dependent lactate racemase [Desulfobacula sp.]